MEVIYPMSETKVKANPDYTASAENLTNAESTVIAYSKWLESKAMLERVNLEIEGKIPTELITAKDAAQKAVALAEKELKETVIAKGGLQDVEAGHYALQQRKVSLEYDPIEFTKWYPDMAKLVIEPSININITKIKGLIKGGLLSESDMKEQGIITAKETLVWQIK
jgi:hypothetical protein